MVCGVAAWLLAAEMGLYEAFPAAFPAALPSTDLDHSLLWVINNGASRHYSSIASDFNDVTLRNDFGGVFGIACYIRGIGTVPFATVDSSGNPLSFSLLDVLYVPDFEHRSAGNYLRLLSVGLAVATGLKCNFTASRDFFNHSYGLHVDLVRHNGLAWLSSFSSAPPCLPSFSLSLGTSFIDDLVTFTKPASSSSIHSAYHVSPVSPSSSLCLSTRNLLHVSPSSPT
jgi:hypothetical protein